MQPRTREERHFFKCKENLERERLRNRTGNYFRYEDVGDPTQQLTNAPAHCSEKNRYVSGGEYIAELNRKDRESDLEHKNAITEARRMDSLKREEERWDAIEKKELHEIDRQRRLIDDDMIGKKNVSGVPYNIVNLEYSKNIEGRRLEHADEMCKYREQVRKQNLAEKAHLGYNCITGEQVYPVPEAVRPAPFVEDP